jgi:SAM-dependent methyltransferase
MSRLIKGRYLSAVDSANLDALVHLQRRMLRYYLNLKYHEEWIKGVNSNWQVGSHNAQLEMCKLIPPGSRILEAGCGDGSGVREITSRVENIKYIGIDLSQNLWRGHNDFVAAKAEELPFQSSSIDVVLSMFVVEHLVFPALFLDETWRVLRSGGRLIIVAPDFASNAMASERIGLSYGSGRAKLERGKILDALLTAYDTRVRLYFMRLYQRRKLRRGLFSFPILTEPRCLHLPGFTPDCDAVYPVCPEEIINYLRQRNDYGPSEVFYRDNSTFGLLIMKQERPSSLQSNDEHRYSHSFLQQR